MARLKLNNSWEGDPTTFCDTYYTQRIGFAGKNPHLEDYVYEYSMQSIEGGH